MTPSLWDAFLINWLFWSGTAIGAVVFAALLDLTNATWATPVRWIALQSRRFLFISLIASAVLLFHAPRVYGRAAGSLVVVYVAAFWFCRNAGRADKAGTPSIVILLIAYVTGFSLLANDAIMSLDPHWVSTLFPAYTFVANVYGGIAMVAAVALVAGGTGRAALDERQRRDLGMVLVGFALIWMYLVWSQYLVIWYGNLPEETAYIGRRLMGGWRTVFWILLAIRFVLPVAVLITRTGRRHGPFTLVAIACVAGFWMEYLLMIGPSSTGFRTFSALAIMLAFAILFFAPMLWGSGAHETWPKADGPRTYSDASPLR